MHDQTSVAHRGHDHHQDQDHGGAPSFTRSLACWMVGMVALIGGLSFAGVSWATGSWIDGAVVAGFLSTFIAPALGGLLAGVLWFDRHERSPGATSNRPTVVPPGTMPPAGVRPTAGAAPARAA